MIQIIPAILAVTEEDYKRDLATIKKAKLFKWVHIDFTDNEFVQNTTIGIEIVGQTSTNLNKEAHLMVNHPLQWLDKLKNAGFKRVVFHFESQDDVLECLNKIKKLGMEAGVALNINTPIEKLTPFKDCIDLVLIMAIVPGFQGQPFLPEALDKIKALKAKNWPLRISVDGAVRSINAKQLVQAGVNQLTVGSFLLTGDIDENVERLWKALRLRSG